MTYNEFSKQLKDLCKIKEDKTTMEQKIKTFCEPLNIKVCSPDEYALYDTFLELEYEGIYFGKIRKNTIRYDFTEEMPVTIDKFRKFELKDAIYSLFNYQLELQIKNIDANIEHDLQMVERMKSEKESLMAKFKKIGNYHFTNFVKIVPADHSPQACIVINTYFKVNIYNNPNASAQNDDTYVGSFEIKNADLEPYKNSFGGLSEKAFEKYIDTKVAQYIFEGAIYDNAPSDEMCELSNRITEECKKRLFNEIKDSYERSEKGKVAGYNEDLDEIYIYAPDGLTIIDISNPYDKKEIISPVLHQIRSYANMTSREIMKIVRPVRRFAKANKIQDDMPSNEDCEEGLKYLASSKGYDFTKIMHAFKDLLHNVNKFAKENFTKI